MRRPLSLLFLSSLSFLAFACVTPSVEIEAEAEPAASTEAAVSSSACLFGSTRQSFETSSSLSVGPARKIQAGAQLSADDGRQLAWLGQGNAQQFLARTDDDEVLVRSITERASGRSFTWISWHAGDNPQGHVFVGNSTARAASIGDDSVYACTVSAQPSASSIASCAFGNSIEELDASNAFSRSSFRTLTKSTNVSSIQREQLRAIDAYSSSTQSSIFSWVDGGRISVRSLQHLATGKRFTEYRALRGGALIHRLFAEGTLDLALSSVEGGEIVNCTFGAPNRTRTGSTKP